MTEETRVQPSKPRARRRKDSPRPSGTGSERRTTPEERQRLIAEKAYFRAEERGFHGGDPTRDWLEAEAEIDAWLVRGNDESDDRPGAKR